MKRTILHCDMNSFFASVELLDRADLKGLPVAVSGNPDNRHGIILAKNDLAKSFGVVTAETIAQARKKCPALICIPPHHEKYKHYYKIINEIYGRFTDMVEPFSIDESWLDVTASEKLFGTGVEIADKIRSIVKEETGLTLSAGVSFNKFFAKMGSDYKKPDATTYISEENFKEILWPLDISEMFMVGKASSAKLRQNGIHTIGALAESDPIFLASILGSNGIYLHNCANGLDSSPVAMQNEHTAPKSIGNGRTFKQDIYGENDIRAAILGLSDKVCSRLRAHGEKANGVKLDIKSPTFSVLSRQKQLDAPTDSPSLLAKVAYEILLQNWNINMPIRMLTVTAINLSRGDEPVQISLFSGVANYEHEDKINDALDSIRKKYGSGSITFGRILSSDIIIDDD